MRLLLFLLKSSRRYMLPTIIIGVLAGAASAALMALINTTIATPENLRSSRLGVYVLLVVLMLVSGLVSRILSALLTQRNGFEVRMNICRQILNAPLRQLEELGPHRILAVLTDDVPTISGALLQFPQLCINFAILLGCLIYLGWLSTTALIGLVIFLVVAVASYVIPEKAARAYYKRGREDWDQSVGNFRSLIDGNKELKLHSRRREAFFMDNLYATAMSLRRNYLVGASIYAVIGSGSQVLYFLFIGLILFLLPKIEPTNTEQLTGCALTALFMGGPIIAILNVLPFMSRAEIAVNKIKSLRKSFDLKKSDEAPATVQPSPTWNRLELKGVTHTYRSERNDSNFILGPIDLTLRPGELVVIAGGNGSGKTTLAKLLTGLYVPESGSITLDGELVTDENRDTYRQNFSVVFTDFYLFDRLHGLDGPNSDEEAQRYLEKLQLEQKVQITDGRLSTTNLSQGQRKRLALLTAYLENRSIYIFDEWAADQDPMFKEVFYYELLPELKARGKLALVISHDDRYYEIADRIVKLDYGRIQYDKYQLRQLSDTGSEAVVLSNVTAG
jgi:putative pyoverdin transport system ATP-binding/permease protein